MSFRRGLDHYVTPGASPERQTQLAGETVRPVENFLADVGARLAS
jgi:hypothetical protein